REALQEAQTQPPALLGVKLGREQVVATDRTAEVAAVVAQREHRLRLLRLEVIGVHEIELVSGLDALEQEVRARRPPFLPADVRHLERGIGELEAPGHARDQPEPLGLALLGAVQQQLRAHADAEDRRAARKSFAKRLAQTGARQRLHAAARMADA